MPWPFVVLAMFAGTFALMLATGFVLMLLAKLYVRLGNPGQLISERARPGQRDPGQGYYVEPNDGGD